MSIQFFSIDPSILESSTDHVTNLDQCSKSSLSVSGDAMVALVVVHHAANDLSRSPESEVGSIGKLISRGTALYSPKDGSFVHHLSRELLSDAMIEFSRLTSDCFVDMAQRCLDSGFHGLPDNQSPDEILHEFSNPVPSPVLTDEAGESTENEDVDWLERFHWTTICEFRAFIDNAIKLNAEVLRLTH